MCPVPNMGIYFILVIIIWPVIGFRGSRKIVGLFRNDICSPAAAASLAVDVFNEENALAETFTFQNEIVQKTNAQHNGINNQEIPQFQDTFYETLRNSIAITGDPGICEKISEIISSKTYLVCYGPPTPSTIHKVEATAAPRPNIYLSQPNPRAFEHCLLKVIKLLLTFRDEAYISDTTKEAKDPLPNLTVLLMFDPNHPASVAQVDKALLHNLRKLNGVEVHVSSSISNNTDSFPDLNTLNRDSGLLLIVAAIGEFQARSLFCSLQKRKFCGQNVLPIFLSGGAFGHFKPTLQGQLPKVEFGCSHRELLQTAEGHMRLEIPAWEISNQRNLRIGWQLNHTLWKNRAFHQFDYDEGPLAFDSVWAMLRAITEAEQQHPQASSSNDAGNDDNKLAFDFDSVVEEQLATWFNGLSGEMSFRRRQRRGNKATIILSMFENGSYVQVAKHFNSNDSFPWDNRNKFFHPAGPLGNGNNNNKNKDVVYIQYWNSTWKSIDPECSSLSSAPSSETKAELEDCSPCPLACILLITLLIIVALPLATISVFVVFTSVKHFWKQRSWPSGRVSMSTVNNFQSLLSMERDRV